MNRMMTKNWLKWFFQMLEGMSDDDEWKPSWSPSATFSRRSFLFLFWFPVEALFLALSFGFLFSFHSISPTPDSLAVSFFWFFSIVTPKNPLSRCFFSPLSLRLLPRFFPCSHSAVLPLSVFFISFSVALSLYLSSSQPFLSSQVTDFSQIFLLSVFSFPNPQPQILAVNLSPFFFSVDYPFLPCGCPSFCYLY